NPVSALTIAQLRAIYEGKITNWKDVGGKDAKIVVVSREEGSGMRDCFGSKVTEDIKTDALFYDSNGAIKTKVSSEPNAIGFLSLGYAEGLKTVALDGVNPTIESCKNGKYPVVRRLYLLTRQIPTGEVKAFLDFCRSEEGQKIVAEQGYVPIAK
ncbi:MAG: phosphate ABC transporter substrate-binding protein, partial [Chloroflexi bacterium]|nr:phosphate ABC transporter substrate-binding protein [Chloroflexota bacterium]